MVNINYTISTSFSNGVDMQQLIQEIKTSSITVSFTSASISNNILTLVFESAITGTNLTVLNSIISTHSPKQISSYQNAKELLSEIAINKCVNPKEAFIGKLVNTSGRIFTTTGIDYVIDNSVYRIGASSITLDQSHASLNRYDIIYGDTRSILLKITGTPSSSPVVPTLPNNAILFNWVYIPANQSTPQITYTNIYTENSNSEFTCSENTSNTRIILNNNSNTFAGSKSIQLSNPVTNDIITFTSSSPLTIATFSSLELMILSSSNLSSDNYFSILCKLYYSNEHYGNIINILNPIFGFNKNNSSSYQSVSIPISSFSFSNNLLDKIEFIINKPYTNSNYVLYLDNIRFQSGLLNIETYQNNTITNSFDNLNKKIKVYHISDTKPVGTNGGTFSNNSWTTRTLNTMNSTGNDVLLANNQFTLYPGIWEITAHVPAYGVKLHKAKLRNVTTNTDICLGTNAYALNVGLVDSQSSSFISCSIELVATNVFEIQHWCSYTQSTTGFGLATGIPSCPEIYTTVKCMKLE